MRRIAALTLFFALLLPATAMAAGNSTCQAYNPQLCSTVGSGSVLRTTSAGSTAKTLPFTGLDAFLLVGGGAALLMAGLTVRVVARRLD